MAVLNLRGERIPTIVCELCGKDMANPVDPRRSIGLTTLVPDDRKSLDITLYLNRQLGGFESNRPYHICMECYLKKMGFVPTKRTERKETDV